MARREGKDLFSDLGRVAAMRADFPSSDRSGCFYATAGMLPLVVVQVTYNLYAHTMKKMGMTPLLWIQTTVLEARTGQCVSLREYWGGIWRDHCKLHWSLNFVSAPEKAAQSHGGNNLFYRD